MSKIKETLINQNVHIDLYPNDEDYLYEEWLKQEEEKEIYYASLVETKQNADIIN